MTGKKLYSVCFPGTPIVSEIGLAPFICGKISNNWTAEHISCFKYFMNDYYYHAELTLSIPGTALAVVKYIFLI